MTLKEKISLLICSEGQKIILEDKSKLEQYILEFLKVPPKIKTESEKKNKTKLKFHDELFKTARKESDQRESYPKKRKLFKEK